MLKRPFLFEALGFVVLSPDPALRGGHARPSCGCGSARLPRMLGSSWGVGVVTTRAAGSGLDLAGVCGVRGDMPRRTSSSTISASTSVSFEICVLATETVVAVD